MSSSYSDHKKPYNNINSYLPEVYQSSVNTSLFETAFNRHLTRDDTTRVAGFIGEGNPQALVDRQLPEPTPHRQAFQLAPTMYSTVGTVESALSFKAFQGQLELMGVNLSRMDKWGATQRFNWVPPVNLDMIVNYQDYFWSAANTTDPAQYITIENPCSKAVSTVQAYSDMLLTRGGTFAVHSINYSLDQLVLNGKVDDLFVDGFVFYTTGNTNPNLSQREWTVATSTYSLSDNQTTINVIESIADAGPNPPDSPSVGKWWYDTNVSTLKEWDGSDFVLAVQSHAVNVDLLRQLQLYQYAANCACAKSYGWDSGEWDGVPDGTVFPPNPDVDPSAQNNPNNPTNQSTRIPGLGLNEQWDYASECATRENSVWATQNRWVHKSQVRSFADVKRAQLPILEYNSSMELNEWTEVVHSWKYRDGNEGNFNQTSNQPHKFEMEPVKGFIASSEGGLWRLFMFDRQQAMTINADYTDTFTPGYQFRVTDDTNSSQIYTVGSVEYRELTSEDPASVIAATGTGVLCTIVTLSETIYTSPLVGGTALHTRLEPIRTSLGHTWRGYHVHWVMNPAATRLIPSTHRPISHFLTLGLADAPAGIPASTLPLHQDDSTPFQPNTGVVVVSREHQEVEVGADGITRIDLADKFRLIDGESNLYASPNSNEVRVYVNGVRQYATYTEVVGVADDSSFTVTSFYTLVGQSAQQTQQIRYVRAIVFNQPLVPFDVVRIEVGPASQDDAGNYSVPVRTLEDETEFAVGTATGTQPEYVSFCRYNRVEQSKPQVNQYPQFNIYDVTTSTVIAAAPTFAYREDSDAQINQSIGMRIAADPKNRNFGFEQSLLDRDDNALYGFRNRSKITPYWFTPATNTLYGWDGYAWTSHLPVQLASGVAFRRAVVSDFVPEVGEIEVGGVWVNTQTYQMFRCTQATPEVIVVPLSGMTVSDTDPSLETVWNPGTTPSTYVPTYVDGKGKPVANGSSDGDWELASQWRYNAQHKNRKNVTFSEIIAHFSSILTAQRRIPGLTGGGVHTRIQDEMDYGRGGTIKEHNDSYDTLISAVNITSVTPIGVMEFANQQYATGLLMIRDIFNRSIGEYLTSYNPQAVVDLTSYVSDQVIERYESNDFTAQLYHDSSAYDPSTKLGVRNWIATAPILGLSASYRPHLDVMNGVVYLYHHDGHRTEIQYTGAEFDKYARAACNRRDLRAGNGGTFGKISATPFPDVFSELSEHYGAPRAGVLWYHTGGGQRTLYRFVPYSISGSDPSIFYPDGTQLPDGAMYYNTSAQAVYEKIGTQWTPITTLGNGDITPLWQVISLPAILGAIQLNIENKLFEAASNVDQVFDYETLVSTSESIAEFNKQNRHRFTAFLSAYGITAPFINIDYAPTDAFTWNYVGSVSTSPPRTDRTPPALTACWQALYTDWYGTPYPHLEPWKLQGFADKPTWWEVEYASTSNRRWTTSMWTNIRHGVVPLGRTYPNGSVRTLSNVIQLPTFTYVSVNTADTTAPGGYQPDALLPPYYDNSSAPVSSSGLLVRSIFNSISNEVLSPDADYSFGDSSPAEWAWTVSPQYVYDKAIVAFLMDPVRFTHSTFGPKFTIVNKLQVETTFKQVYSHEDALFHGDVYKVNDVYSVRGLNQWYVNFNRYTGVDTNGEFRQLWAGWEPRLTHQFAGIVDTSTFDIANRYTDIAQQDFKIILVNNGIIHDLWVDSFEASLISIPPSLVQYNNQDAWRIELDTLSSTPRDIQYYGVKSYTFTVNPDSTACTAFSYPIVILSQSALRFEVNGDQTGELRPGSTFVVVNSTGNDGLYTITATAHDASTNRTRVTVSQPIAHPTADGQVNLVKQLPWQTGDAVVLSSSKFLPSPLLTDTLYYVIATSANAFALAETRDEALLGEAISIISPGTGVLTVSQVKSSFRVLGGAGNSAEIWYHYALDTTDLRTFQAPVSIVGMQSFINLIDGYAEHARVVGHLQNLADSSDFDPDTGRLAGWEVETERFINWAYGLRQARVSVADRYPAFVNTTTNTVTFGSTIPMWLAGTAISVTSSGELAQPLISGSVYYIVNTGTQGVVRLSTSPNATDFGSYIDFTTPGTGQLMMGLYDRNRAFPRFELNASRNNMWINTPLGVLSNAVSGPYDDIRVNQTVFDQYSRPVGSDKLTVYRQDERTHIQIRPSIENDVDQIYSDDPYNYIHFGGAHLFVESFEHFLVFENYTVSGAMIYDQFFGLQTQRFTVDYSEKTEYTLRPTLGGYYLLDQQFKRNLEGATQDVQHYYDAYELAESTPVAQRSRGLLGYKGRSSFLDLLNINSKSQFLFYQGLVQTKGSMKSISAFTNSRRFVDARLDEFWAWRMSEYGDSRTKVYPEIKLFSTDGAFDDIRFQFLAQSERETDADIVADAARGFQPVSFRDDSRWNLFPEQKENIKTQLFLDTEVSSVITIFSGVVLPPAGYEQIVTYWFDPVARELWAYGNVNGANGWLVNETNRISIDTVVDQSGAPVGVLYLKLEEPIDDARVVRKSLNKTTTPIISVSGADFTVDGNQTSVFAVGQELSLIGSPTSDGPYLVAGIALSGPNTTLTLSPTRGQVVAASANQGLLVVQDFSSYTLEVYNAGAGEREFTRVNSQLIRFRLGGVDDMIQIFTLVPPRTSMDPARLIDTKSETTVQAVPLWDPARSYHTNVAIHNVDITRAGDPARYSSTLASNQGGYIWNRPEVGTTWFDTASLGYVPYYDDQITPDINDRLYNWGKLAPWSTIDIYQWVSSPVPPSDWDRRVIAHSGDSTIQQSEKASGTPLKTTFKRVRSDISVVGVDVAGLTSPGSVRLPVDAQVTFDNEDSIIFVATTLPEGLQVGQKYVVRNKTAIDSSVYSVELMDASDESLVTITTTGSNDLRAVPAFSADDWTIQSVIRDRIYAAFALSDKRLIEATAGAHNWVDYSVTGNLYWKPTDRSLWVVSSNGSNGSDIVDVYINGKLVDSSIAVGEQTTAHGSYLYINVTDLGLQEFDIIDIVRPVHAMTTEESAFDPASEDDGTVMVQWREEFQYSTTVLATNSNTTTSPMYYFWVKGSTTRPTHRPDAMSGMEIAMQLENIPTPYMVLQRPKDDPYLLETYGYGSTQYGSVFSTGILLEAEYQIPILYRQVIVRKVSSYLDDDDRYVLRFTRDFTLRDDLEANGRQLNLKDTHNEWLLFRRDQPTAITRQLWDRLTEALSGRKLERTRTLTVTNQPVLVGVVGQTVLLGHPNVSGVAIHETDSPFNLVEDVDYILNLEEGSVRLISVSKLTGAAPYHLSAQYTFDQVIDRGVRVPSLDRELYDTLYGTDTQYGIGVGQAFVNKLAGLRTIRSFLTDATRDFSPIDIDTFLAENQFDTPAEIERTMDLMYTSFDARVVNDLWFELLHDALSTKTRYSDIMKSSWIALHGIRVLEVGGLFDD